MNIVNQWKIPTHKQQVFFRKNIKDIEEFLISVENFRIIPLSVPLKEKVKILNTATRF